MNATGFRIVGMLAALVLAACQSSANQALTPATGVQGMEQRVAAKRAPANLYVANASTVTVYAPGSISVLRTISKLTPTALAFDKQGNLYVGDFPSGAGPEVAIYAARSATLLRSLKQEGSFTRALAFDAAGNLYVGTDFAGVSVYTPSSTTASRLIPVFYPLSLAFDASGNLFVGNTTGPYGGGEPDSVAVVAPGSTTISRQIIKGILLPVAEVTDASGNLFVANQSKNDVTVYAPGAMSPSRTIREGIKLPSALAFDGSGNLYVASSGANTVTVYAPGSTSVLRTIRSGVLAPSALAIDAAGDVYVANKNKGSVTVYAPNSTSLLRTITKGISKPVALGFGP